MARNPKDLERFQDYPYKPGLYEGLTREQMDEYRTTKVRALFDGSIWKAARFAFLTALVIFVVLVELIARGCK